MKERRKRMLGTTNALLLRSESESEKCNTRICVTTLFSLCPPIFEPLDFQAPSMAQGAGGGGGREGRSC